MTALVQFAGAVAHELNNIFTAVVGNLSLLSEDIADEHAHVQTIGEVVRTAQRGIALSEKLQAFAGRQPLKRRNTDVAGLLEETVRDLRGLLPKTVDIELRIASNQVRCFVDDQKLRVCIEEIAANACSAMNGAGVLSIELAHHEKDPAEQRFRHGRYLCIRISDSGPGMTPEIAARALDPLFSTRASSIHVGWGLSNCAGFCRQSGGVMSVSTGPGEGTIVELLLPAGEMTSISAQPRAVSGAAI